MGCVNVVKGNFSMTKKGHIYKKPAADSLQIKGSLTTVVIIEN